MSTQIDLGIGCWIQDVPYYIDGFKRYYSPLDSLFILDTLSELRECDGNLFGITEGRTNKLNGRDFPHKLVRTITPPEKLYQSKPKTGDVVPRKSDIPLHKGLISTMSLEQLATGFLKNKNLIFLHSLMNNVDCDINFTFYCENENIQVVCSKKHYASTTFIKSVISNSPINSPISEKGCACVIPISHIPKWENKPLAFSHLVWNNTNYTIDYSMKDVLQRYYIRHNPNDVIIDTYDDEWTKEDVFDIFASKNMRCINEYKGMVIKKSVSDIFCIEIITKWGVKYRREYPENDNKISYSIYLPEDTRVAYNSSYIELSNNGEEWLYDNFVLILERGHMSIDDILLLFPISKGIFFSESIVRILSKLKNKPLKFSNKVRDCVFSDKKIESMIAMYGSILLDKLTGHTKFSFSTKCMMEILRDDFPNTIPRPMVSYCGDGYYVIKYNTTEDCNIDDIINPYFQSRDVWKLINISDFVYFVTETTIYSIYKSYIDKVFKGISYQTHENDEVDPGIYYQMSRVVIGKTTFM